MTIGQSASLGFDFEEDPRDLDDNELSACPLPPIAGSCATVHGAPRGLLSAVQTTQMGYPVGIQLARLQKWKTYRLLAHCIVARDFQIAGSTDIIGGIHPGSIVVALEERGNRIKIQIPTFGWYSSIGYQNERFGWMDVQSPTGERLAVQMPPRQLVHTGVEGEVEMVAAPNEEVAYPSGIIHPQTQGNFQPVQRVESPAVTPTALFLPKQNSSQAAVYQPTSPKDLPTVFPHGSATPSPKNEAVTPTATPVSHWRSAAGKKPIPLLRKPKVPVLGLVPASSATTPNAQRAMVPSPAAKSARGKAGPRSAQPGAPTMEKMDNIPRSRKRRMPQFRDKHQATVSHTPGVILYPRDPVTGHVIIPKHIIAARRKRRPPCKSNRRGPNPWNKRNSKKSVKA